MYPLLHNMTIQRIVKAMSNNIKSASKVLVTMLSNCMVLYLGESGVKYVAYWKTSSNLWLSCFQTESHEFLNLPAHLSSLPVIDNQNTMNAAATRPYPGSRNGKSSNSNGNLIRI